MQKQVVSGESQTMKVKGTKKEKYLVKTKVGKN